MLLTLTREAGGGGEEGRRRRWRRRRVRGGSVHALIDVQVGNG